MSATSSERECNEQDEVRRSDTTTSVSTNTSTSFYSPPVGWEYSHPRPAEGGEGREESTRSQPAEGE